MLPLKYNHVCSMHKLAVRRAEEHARLMDEGREDKARQVRVYPECLPCEGDYGCEFYEQEVGSLMARANGGNGSQKKNLIVPGEVERIIGGIEPGQDLFKHKGGA